MAAPDIRCKETLMKRLIAALVYLLCVIWILLGSLALVASSGWLSNEGFYKGIVGDQKLYQAIGPALYDEMAEGLLTAAQDKTGGRLDKEALAQALKVALQPADIAREANSAVDSVFSSLRKGERAPAFDFTRVKALCLGERFQGIVDAYAGALKPGAEAKDPKAIKDFSAIPSNVSPDAFKLAFGENLKLAIAAIPDNYTVPLTAKESQDFQKAGGVPTPNQLLLWGVLGLCLGVGSLFALSLMVEQNWFLRASWVGGKFLPPAIIVLAVGGIGYLLTDSALSAKFFDDIRAGAHDPYASTLMASMGDAFKSVLRVMTGGFFWAGLIATSVAGSLVSLRRAGAMSQI
jgi:hypothetical protein